MKKKIVKRGVIVLLGIFIVIGACIFPYQVIFMRNSLPDQPALSTVEKQYFNKLKKEFPWNSIERMYYNTDSLGNTIGKRKPINLDSQYLYSVELSTEDIGFYLSNGEKEVITIAKYIRDSICFNSPNLTEIYIELLFFNATEQSGNGNKHLFYKIQIDKDRLYIKQ